MKVIYIAGKYRGPTSWAVEQNIRAAEDVAALVIQAGHMPLTPHKNTAHMEGLADDAFFLRGTLELMRRCDAVLCVPNWRDSAGARGEVAEARRLGLPVFGVGQEFVTSNPESPTGGRFPLTIDGAIDDLNEWAAADPGAYHRGDCWVRGTAQEPDGPDCTEVVLGISDYTLLVENRDIRRYR